MDTFDHLRNWRLKAGSHPFPGPDGGTCINEAAVVAAGFEYKRVRAAEDMPECFSRPICRLAMLLNDEATDTERQRLLPYVTRLACADTPEVEKQRADYVGRQTRVRPISFNRGLEVLEGALAIGRQADPLGPEEVRSRMDKARAEKGKPAWPGAPASVQDKPLVSNAMSWLTIKAIEPLPGPT